MNRALCIATETFALLKSLSQKATTAKITLYKSNNPTSQTFYLKTYYYIYQITTNVRGIYGLEYKFYGGLTIMILATNNQKVALHEFYQLKQKAFREAYETPNTSFGKDESIVFIDAVFPILSTNVSHIWILTRHDKLIARRR
ncbi:hypothetical protein [Vibrio mediterranei]|uniref:hypothetical protein n=1 Tax=Vibrio mediterranei TaxID=689 RepID=UPI00148CFEEE|nr:hypothetical protein [Vibrio mediterranei]NOI25402.1 hypothetical protein [Vibrio mediterranei]